MHNYPIAAQWLTPLSKLLPIRHALLIGAGQNTCAWLTWLQHQAISRIIQIEADAETHAASQAESADAYPNLEYHHQLIAAHSGLTTFYTASLSSENGLIQPEKLTAIWPNIHTIKQHTLPALALAEFTRQQNFQPQLLIINCLGANALLQDAAELLQQVNIIIARTSHDIENLPEADGILLAEYLHTHHFTLIETDQGRHPQIDYSIFVKDHAAQNQTLRNQYQTLAEQNHNQQTTKQALKQQLVQLQHNQAAAQAKLEKAKKWKQTAKKYKQAFADIKKQQQQEQNMLAILAQQNHILEQQQTQLMQHLDTRLQAQTEQLAKHSAQQAGNRPSEDTPDYNQIIQKTEKNIINTLTQRLSNSTTQIEAYIAIQNYLNTGNLLSGFHGWPISPDIGLFIINQMRQTQYDLVIEFGSGTSTLLFAKLAAAHKHAPLMSNLLTKKIISFDHHADYHQQTQMLLNTNQVAEYVDLVHAPLVEWQENGQTFLYYDCAAKLQRLAQDLPEKPAKILVLVDGPPGNTCKDARYPAVPFLLKYFSRHRLDIILDDATRPEEKGVVIKWQDFFNTHKIAYSDEKISNEKGIYFSKINNSNS